MNEVYKKIRLSKKEITCIVNAFKKTFLNQDELWIFGSRADLNKKGGDIDIYIKTNYNDPSIIANAKIKFSNLIFLELEEQKIDIVVQYKNSLNLPIYEIAEAEGVRIL